MFRYAAVTFDEYGPDEPIIPFEVWENHPSLENVRSAFVRFQIGSPAKHVECYALNLHRLFCHVSSLENPSEDPN
jgi:hypothetical protein